jgi:hypothetical protein
MSEPRTPRFADLNVAEADQTRASVVDFLAQHGLVGVQGFDPQEEALKESGADVFLHLMELAEEAKQDDCLLVVVPLVVKSKGGRAVTFVRAKKASPDTP